ncbi:50S ribosomal protein L11 methyltransferase [Arsenicibacter rosenii]|uniref:Ribosomal protein L11 methyltransferase n=1 Tax=Arsenicibacter rosenii TaxID=1750698 RepID=A0A1S2VQF0_9BACT|nr:50S ribosomal protein L11 methyltransferase [Arsenicibacter rosenii]OIN60028.1 ribosomal protein L11 methyltransferase [Arsenicibacter rosenii]
MNYIELSLTLSPDYTDILMAELGELGFESFVETDEGLLAYVTEDLFDETAIQEVIAKYEELTAIAYQVSSLEKKNWNAEWEQNYEPITVGENLVRVRASFHEPDAAFQHELVINPKMSFGTGHHETTSMMLEHQMHIGHAGKAVLDVGSGTGILAILAAKMGASPVVAFDIEEWAVENAVENAGLNNHPEIRVFQGTIADVDPAERYDIVLANINRNVLLVEIPTYVSLLNENGYLFVSGFYEHDAADIEAKANEAGMELVRSLTKNQWSSLVFRKA